MDCVVVFGIVGDFGLVGGVSFVSDDAGIRLECALGDDQIGELLGQVDVGEFQCALDNVTLTGNDRGFGASCFIKITEQIFASCGPRTGNRNCRRT